MQTADAVVIMTEWNEYRVLDLKILKDIMKGNVFIGLKDVYMPDVVKEVGFSYVGVGVLICCIIMLNEKLKFEDTN